MSIAKVYSYALSAGVPKVYPGGRFLRLLVADAAVDIKFFSDAGGEIGSAIGVKGGFALAIDPKEINKDSPLVGFGKVEITSATSQTVEVAISRQPIDYNRITGTITTQISSGTALTQSSVTVGSASGALLAANADRRRATIKNTSETETVYVCDDATTATTSHYPIGPGEKLEVQSEDGLNAIRGGTVDVVVRIIEERD